MKIKGKEVIEKLDKASSVKLRIRILGEIGGIIRNAGYVWRIKRKRRDMKKTKFPSCNTTASVVY